MSASPPLSDLGATAEDFSEVPLPDSCTAANSGLFDHLVSTREDAVRDREPERLRCLAARAARSSPTPARVTRQRAITPPRSSGLAGCPAWLILFPVRPHVDALAASLNSLKFAFPRSALVRFVHVSDAILKLTDSLGQLCSHDVSSANFVHSSGRTIFDPLTEIKLVHQSNRNLVGLAGCSFHLGRMSTVACPHT
jgi:hypothetical protein